MPLPLQYSTQLHFTIALLEAAALCRCRTFITLPWHCLALPCLCCSPQHDAIAPHRTTSLYFALAVLTVRNIAMPLPGNTLRHFAIAEPDKSLPSLNLTEHNHCPTIRYHSLPCLRIILLRLAPFRFAVATRCSELFCYATAKLLSGKPLRY